MNSNFKVENHTCQPSGELSAFPIVFKLSGIVVKSNWWRRCPAIWVVKMILFSYCQYRVGLAPRALPGGYDEIHVPICKNLSLEPHLELAFTRGIIRELERLQVARVVSTPVAPVRFECRLTSVQWIPGGRRQGGDLPSGVVIATDYRMAVTVEGVLRRVSDEVVLWQTRMVRETNYTAPQVIQSVVNTVNATYDQSARQIYLGQLLERVAEEMVRSMSVVKLQEPN